MNPKRPNPDGETSVDEAQDSQKKKRSKKEKKMNLAAGLALMHGFSASNVGPGRLTVSSRICVASPDTY